MSELKTKKNTQSVAQHIAKVTPEDRRADARALLKIFRSATGKSPVMWGDSIIGFGQYHYKSERSAQEGDRPMTGFAIRKQNLTIYIMPGIATYKKILANLGKYKHASSCLYIKKLSDVNISVLTRLIESGFRDMQKKYK